MPILQRSHLASAIGAFALIAAGLWLSHAETAEPQTDRALEEAREDVRMLDDVYKTTIVLITENYVHDETDFGGGPAAKALFAAIEKKGWHSVRLVDLSGEPVSDENLPADAFEKKAAEKLLAGESYFDAVEENDGRRMLRAVTPIPVVMDKCIICHENYRGVPKDQPVGMLGYTMPLDGKPVNNQE
jgi:hypothetical protein